MSNGTIIKLNSAAMLGLVLSIIGLAVTWGRVIQKLDTIADQLSADRAWRIGIETRVGRLEAYTGIGPDGKIRSIQ